MRRILLITNNFQKNSPNQRARKLFRRTEILHELGWETDVVIFNRKSFVGGNEKSLSGVFFPLKFLSLAMKQVRHAIFRIFGPRHLPIIEFSVLFFLACKKIKRNNYDVVITMCSPFTGHATGLLLKYFLRVNWAAEFRDPWVTNENKFPMGAPLLHRLLEKKTVEAADLIVWNRGVQIKDNYFTKTYGDRVRDKLLVLPAPGFEGIENRGLVNYHRDIDNNCFTITYAGGFYEALTPFSLLKGFQRFLRYGQNIRQSCKLRFLGDWDKKYDGYARALDIVDLLDVRGRVKYDECMYFLRMSCVNVLINRGLSRDTLNLPSKVGDYLLAERPILAIAKKNSEVGRFIDNEDLGLVAEPEDVDSIAMHLYSFYTEWRISGATNVRNKRLINMYDMTTVMRKYSERLVSICK